MIWNQDEDPWKIQIIYGTLHLTFDYSSKGSMNNGGMTKLLEPNIYLRSLWIISEHDRWFNYSIQSNNITLFNEQEKSTAKFVMSNKYGWVIHTSLEYNVAYIDLIVFFLVNITNFIVSPCLEFLSKCAKAKAQIKN